MMTTLSSGKSKTYGTRRSPPKAYGSHNAHHSAALYSNAQILAMVRQGNVSSAEDCLNHLVSTKIRPTRTSFHAIINARKAQGDMAKAEFWLRKMLAAGIEPNTVTFTALISGFAQAGDIAGAENWYSRLIQAGCEPNEQTHNAMVGVYTRAGDLASAENWMQSLLKHPTQVQPNIVAFNTLIHAYSQAQLFARAGYWFEEVMKRGMTPNQRTVCALMTCYMENGDTGMLDYYATCMCNSGIGMADLSYNSLIKACARRGDAQQAEKVLNHMLKEGHTVSVSTYNSMIHACTQNGDIDRAEHFVRLMKKRNVAADLVTFNTVINASAASGDAARAQHWLLQMIDAGLTPNEVTYGTICKAYARQGKPGAVRCIMDALDEAGLKLNEYFYASLISAFGAQKPPDVAGAESTFLFMVSKGLKVHSVKRVLARVIGDKRAADLIDISWRSLPMVGVASNISDEWPAHNGQEGATESNRCGPRGMVELPLSAHQLISGRLRREMSRSGGQMYGTALEAAPGTNLEPGEKLGPAPASEIPMPSFLSNREASAVKLPLQIDFPEEATADEAESDIVAELDVNDLMVEKIGDLETTGDSHPLDAAQMRLCL